MAEGHYNRSLLASLDSDHNVVSITAGAVMSDKRWLSSNVAETSRAAHQTKLLRRPG